jgi:glutamine amidotransferase-like uncharacterized protein
MAVLFLLILTLPLNTIEISAAAENSNNSHITEQSQKQAPTVNTTQNSSQSTTTNTYTTNGSTTNGSTTNGSTTNGSIITSSEGDPSTNTISAATNSLNSTAAAYGEGSVTTIKVLIYSGVYAISSCVNGIKTALDYANANSLVPGVTFTYATSTVINSAVLSSYDVLAMPGGSSGRSYINSGSISSSAIKNFVANGGGYLGICAGAYAGSYYVDGMYYGWGVAPHVKCKAVNYVGNSPLTFTTAGQELLGYSSLTLTHFNGPAMYVSGSAVTFATYADGSTGYKNYAAIVGDYYGSGRTVLVGPHPELSSFAPQYPDIVAKLITWAANISADSGNTPTTFTRDQVSTAAATVKSYFESNKRLPNYVNINNQQVTMASFLNLLTTATLQVNSGSTTDIPLKSVNPPNNESGTIKSGNIQKSEFLTMAQTIKSFIDSNGRAPNYVTTSLGNMKFTSVVYMFSKIMNYYKTYNRLPNYVSMTA